MTILIMFGLIVGLILLMAWLEQRELNVINQCLKMNANKDLQLEREAIEDRKMLAQSLDKLDEKLRRYTDAGTKVIAAEYCELEKKTIALAETLKNGTWFNSDEVDRMKKDIEWLKLRAAAPMTLILDQKKPLKVLHRQAMLKKTSEQIKELST